MELQQKIRTLPISPGVYMYKNAEGEVIYVGKAKSLRARVRSYLLEAATQDAKTGSLMREAVDVEYIVVENEREALALENNLIKQKKPRFNILLRDDKTYPYIKLTLGDRFPKVFVTRRLKKDGSAYYGPYFPANLAHRTVDLIHRSFLIPSCNIDLSRYHPRPCLQYYIKRCLGPCVKDLTTADRYTDAVRDVQLFLEDLPEFELIPGSEDVEFGAGPKNAGKRLEFHPGLFFAALLKQVYIDQQYVPRAILVPVDFDERGALEELLADKRGSKVEI